MHKQQQIKIPIKEKRNQSTKKKYNKRPNSKSHTANKDYHQKGNNQKKNKDGYYNNLVNEILSVDGSGGANQQEAKEALLLFYASKRFIS